MGRRILALWTISCAIFLKINWVTDVRYHRECCLPFFSFFWTKSHYLSSQNKLDLNLLQYYMIFEWTEAFGVIRRHVFHWIFWYPLNHLDSDIPFYLLESVNSASCTIAFIFVVKPSCYRMDSSVKFLTYIFYEVAFKLSFLFIIK